MNFIIFLLLHFWESITHFLYLNFHGWLWNFFHTKFTFVLDTFIKFILLPQTLCTKTKPSRMNFFGTSECSLHVRDLRHHKSEPRDCASLNMAPTTKLMHPTEPVLYHGTNGVPDNRMVWAALTPRGTQHFISENYPRDLVDYAETEDHYETVDYMQPVLTHSGYSTYSSKGLGKFLDDFFVYCLCLELFQNILSKRFLFLLLI